MGLLAILAQPCAECTDTKSGSGILISNKEVGLRSRACPRSPGALQPRASSAGEAHRRQASDRCIRREASGPAPKQAAYAARPGRICRARVQGPAGICAATGPAPDKRGFCLPRRSERSASEVLPPFRRDGTGGVRRCAWWPGWALRLAVRPRCSTVQGGSLCDVTVRPRMLVLGAGSKPRGGGGNRLFSCPGDATHWNQSQRAAVRIVVETSLQARTVWAKPRAWCFASIPTPVPVSERRCIQGPRPATLTRRCISGAECLDGPCRSRAQNAADGECAPQPRPGGCSLALPLALPLACYPCGWLMLGAPHPMPPLPIAPPRPMQRRQGIHELIWPASLHLPPSQPRRRANEGTSEAGCHPEPAAASHRWSHSTKHSLFGRHHNQHISLLLPPSPSSFSSVSRQALVPCSQKNAPD